MTKFEKDLNKKMDLKEVPMYFTQSGCSMTRKTYIETNWIFDNYKNWHSDEEFQEMKESYWNQAESILSMLDEIKSLKSQLQHQALPVVPELTQKQADTLNDYKNGSGSLVSYLSTEIKKGDYDYFARAWLDGYTVEKPQLFYLRDELTGQFLAKDNQFKNEDRYFFWTGADPLTHSIGTAWKLTFTQQEIDSMQTGSYEQIPVPVEDGE